MDNNICIVEPGFIPVQVRLVSKFKKNKQIIFFIQ